MTTSPITSRPRSGFVFSINTRISQSTPAREKNHGTTRDAGTHRTRPARRRKRDRPHHGHRGRFAGDRDSAEPSFPHRGSSAAGGDQRQVGFLSGETYSRL